jgi:hypothetical protein
VSKESWNSVIWFKRIIPFVVLVAGWFCYQEYNAWSTQKVATQDEIMAQATARIWVAAGEFREDPERYLEYRDSVLTASGLTLDQMKGLIKRCESDPAGLFPFTQSVYDLVDSLSRVSDSVSRVADSIAQANAVDSIEQPDADDSIEQANAVDSVEPSDSLNLSDRIK